MGRPRAHRRPRHPRREDQPLRAPAEDQQRLLELQAIDTRLDQLAHRRHGLPEVAELARLDARLAALRDLVVAAETELSDTERHRAKADADVEQVRQRAARDQRRLDAGQVSSPRELESLQHEIASLARRQSDLEDVELEIMERLEATETRLGELARERDALSENRAVLVARRDGAFAEIDGEAAAAVRTRAATAESIDGQLVTLYEKVREQQGGVGAAVLTQGRCQGCRLELNTVELNRIRAAPEDEVLRCEECRRILVRTAISGV